MHKYFLGMKSLFFKYIKYIVMFFAVSLYVYLTLTNPSMKTFNQDEFHCWNIASNFGFTDIIRLMRSEGHTFLWYFILKPFTYFDNIFFPWIIKYINWFFLALAIIILWLKSPFNLFTKIAVTFSYPFLSLYPIHGRCYGIGMFFLFLVLTIYNKRLEKPFIFALLLFFTANTSLMASIAVFPLAVEFLYRLIKIKKIYPILLLLLIPLSLYFQWHDPIIPGYAQCCYLPENLQNLIFYDFKYLFLNKIVFVLAPLLVILLAISLIKVKTSLSYLTYTYMLFLIWALSIYCCNDYHAYFLLIYAIVAVWICDTKYIKKPQLFLILLLLLYNFHFVKQYTFFNAANYEKVVTQCIKNNIPAGSTIYGYLNRFQCILPYLQDDYNIKTWKNTPMISLDTFQNIYTVKYLYIDLKYMQDVAPNGSYIVINTSNANIIEFQNKHLPTKVSMVCKCRPYTIYKIK